MELKAKVAEDFSQIRKKVDEDWKAQIERERSAAQGGRPSPERPRAQEPQQQGPQEKSPADFGVFLSTLSMQALVALGEVPHPQTRAQEIDLEQARYLIDLMGMLQEKTKGNLTAEEAQALEGILYELRTKYVTKAQGARR